MTISQKKHVPYGQALEDPTNNKCSCVSCTEKQACHNHRCTDWDSTTNKCKIIFSRSRCNYRGYGWSYSSGCYGGLALLCDRNKTCCDDDFTEKTCPYGQALEDPTNNKCSCVSCTEKQACHNHRCTDWDSTTNKCKIIFSRSRCNYRGHGWSYSSGCYGGLALLCDRNKTCCDDDFTEKTCPYGQALEDPTNNKCSCVSCTEKQACHNHRCTDWDSTTNKCKIIFSRSRCNYRGHGWSYSSGCYGGLALLCDRNKTCCDDDFTEKTCPYGQALEDPTNNKCSCVSCTEKQACHNHRCTDWDSTTNKCKIIFSRSRCNYRGHGWSYSSGCYGGLALLCDRNKTCCDDDFTEKTCPYGQVLEDPTNNKCSCIACTEETACRNNHCTDWVAANDTCIIDTTKCPHYADYKWWYASGCYGSIIKKCTSTCDSSSQCCVSNNFEVVSDSDADLTCDHWFGSWKKSDNDKGCCVCKQGSSFQYDATLSNGGCCEQGKSWDGATKTCK